jgi:hypothetical protein
MAEKSSYLFHQNDLSRVDGDDDLQITWLYVK